jgi:hypothetical protein
MSLEEERSAAVFILTINARHAAALSLWTHRVLETPLSPDSFCISRDWAYATQVELWYKRRTEPSGLPSAAGERD